MWRTQGVHDRRGLVGPLPNRVWPRGTQHTRSWEVPNRLRILSVWNARSLTSLSDDELLRHVSDLIQKSRRDEADIVSHIGEIDSRRLYAREACSSMFAYCTEVLHLSEAEAYLRIAAARASREHPLLLTMLADGRLHLTAIAKLAPHLTAENREVLLERAAHRSRRQVEELVAEISPRPDTPALMRKLPSRRDGPLPSPRPGPDTDASSIELRPDGVASTGAPLRPDGVAPSDRQSHSGGTALVDRQLRT